MTLGWRSWIVLITFGRQWSTSVFVGLRFFFGPVGFPSSSRSRSQDQQIVELVIQQSSRRLTPRSISASLRSASACSISPERTISARFRRVIVR